MNLSVQERLQIMSYIDKGTIDDYNVDTFSSLHSRKELNIMAAKFELFRSQKNKQYRWRLRHGNGKIIASSGESYHNITDARNGILSVKRNASSASVDDQTKKKS